VQTTLPVDLTRRLCVHRRRCCRTTQVRRHISTGRRSNSYSHRPSGNIVLVTPSLTHLDGVDCSPQLPLYSLRSSSLLLWHPVRLVIFSLKICWVVTLYYSCSPMCIDKRATNYSGHCTVTIVCDCSSTEAGTVARGTVI